MSSPPALGEGREEGKEEEKEGRGRVGCAATWREEGRAGRKGERVEGGGEEEEEEGGTMLGPRRAPVVLVVVRYTFEWRMRR